MAPLNLSDVIGHFFEKSSSGGCHAVTPSFSVFQRLFRLPAVMVRNYMAVLLLMLAVKRNRKPILRCYRVSRRDIPVQGNSS